MRPRIIAGWLVALAAVPALAAVMVARSGGPVPVSLTGTGQQFLATAELDRAATGVIEVEIGLRRSDGSAAGDVRGVAVSGVMPAMGHVTPEISAQPAGADRYRVRGELFSMPGTWQLDIRVDTASGPDVIDIEVPVE
ncbi:FixH family protein [Streptomyces chartreusis]|uniref:FixH family protein n=1 Tax=Streptomyces chartreusis TaxID=1969 RepID=UPI003684632D